MAGVTHADIDLCMLYDSFTITVLLTLENLGFCKKGEGGAFVQSGRLGLGGALPINTDGGGLSSNHPGMRGIFLVIEAVKQLRGECGERQVNDCEIALCHGTGGMLGLRHSGVTMILERCTRGASAPRPMMTLTRNMPSRCRASTRSRRASGKRCRRHELYMQRCRDCRRSATIRAPLCPSCLSERTEWVRCSGTGHGLYLHGDAIRTRAPGFRDALPYVLAYVELAEGVRMLTNIVGCAPDDVRIGMPVEVVFDDVTPTVTLPKFKPAE